MASTAYRRWITTSATALDEIEQAHAFIGGTGPGRRYATQQMNHAYAVLLQRSSKASAGICTRNV